MTASTRRPLVAGNWKLHNTVSDAVALARDVAGRVAGARRADVAVAPVFTALSEVSRALEGTGVALVAQDCYWEDQGAFTGAVSVPLLADVGCRMCIVGHSERRHIFGESNDDVRRKVRALLGHAMDTILCVGETLEEREGGATLKVVLGQVDAALSDLVAADLGRVVIAYEPVWAIGTGRTASPSDAQEVHQAIRERIAEGHGRGVAEGLRILYGGSVKPDNAGALMAQPDIDGALVGGASLKAESFAAIVEAAS